MANYWLAKSEPDVYSIDDLKRDRYTVWDGVRNYQARNFLRDGWKPGDKVLFYHSNTKPIGVAGVAEVVEIDLPDPAQFDKKSKYYDPKSPKDAPRWWAPKVKFVQKFPEVVSLEQMRHTSHLKDMIVLKRGARLSVQPVTKREFDTICKLALS